MPGRIPKNAPIAVPRSVGQAETFKSASVGMRPLISFVKTSCGSGFSRFFTISGDGEQAHGHDREADAVGEFG